MDINIEKLKYSILKLSKLNLQNNDFTNFLRLNNYGEKEICNIFKHLGQKLLDKDWTIIIANEFREFLLQLISNVIPLNTEINDFKEYQIKCLALAKLIKFSVDIQEYSLKYFINKPAPFDDADYKSNEGNKKKINRVEVSDKEIIKCCHDFIETNSDYFKETWDWSLFLEKFYNKGDYEQKIYCNRIIAILTSMTEFQLSNINSEIPPGFLYDFDEIQNNSIPFENCDFTVDNSQKIVKWNITNSNIIDVEGVLLPIYNKSNVDHLEFNKNEIIKVDSTKINLRNIAIGIACGKTICISGPVGCGKTCLIEYLAKITGRICPNNHKTEFYHSKNSDVQEDDSLEQTRISPISCKRKNIENNRSGNNAETNGFEKMDNENYLKRNGFLRIQLGDQTDSKMLLGQYHCTDVPGEFIWSPGVLTQAVINGLWLLLEDIDLATQDTFTILSNLLETKSLCVPGFRDSIKIAPGFQLFFTLRTTNLNNSTQKSFIPLLNKYLYTVNIIPLSKGELAFIVCENFPNLKDIASRMVDMYLNFSNGNHFDVTYELDNHMAIDNEALNFNGNKFLSTSERLVSTRDFIKLCQRCDPTFSKTSAECAFFIFQNAVDLFCSHLQQGKIKLKFISDVGAKLGINPSRCEHYANEYKPDITLDDFRFKVGRAELRRKSKLSSNFNNDEELLNKKRLKLSENSEKEISFSTKIKKKPSETFSFTRISLCLLEHIAVCINQNEPILLVGETGVGKTSSINYLASQTNHKLIVVNMNNQSDVCDLVGGFKPVDLSYVMAPLRRDFENLFRKTFNESKNEKFLHKISICYNQGSFDVIVKLILKIIDSVFEKAKIKEDHITKKVLNEWIDLHKRVHKLNSQIQKSSNISFAFIPGALVNCIQNGDWILLDELNLASAETLECLSAILEPSGSIILLERGDFAPVNRHPNFRIFACMNPNTDIGKKDLPTGIRNRFTEFYVDELTTDYDLTLLINDYLLNTGIKKLKISNLVKLYKKLRSLSELELNDGLGNRPVYSLRNLCRALRICSKNLCGSIERNLYESFCLSFLTQLDIMSHKFVLNLIKENMLGKNQNAILSQGIPVPGKNFLNFEGYWIEQGPKIIEDCNYYILTESVQQNLKDLARIISIGKLPILLQGPTSAGKTSLIEYIAKKSGNTCLRVNNHEHTDLQEYIGTYVSDTTGKLTFKEGVLVQAMRKGYWIILDELNLASSDILEALNRVLDDNRELFIPETQAIIKAHKNFMLFATQNPPGLYGGRKTLSRAFKNRFVELHFSEIPSNELEVILEKRCLIPKSYSKKMVICMNELQHNRKTTSKNNFTLRDLFRWGNRYTFANKMLLEDSKYDWNQHLVDEGYLVLSGKVRTEVDEEIIHDALRKYFKKAVNTETLFNYNEKTSMVTKYILHDLYEFKNRSDIIWTHNMKRMAVLTAKCLEFNEPVLLVGPTGCGKTTICQILAAIRNTNLRILNCHMHTEGADFLGGLRPHRNTNNDVKNESENKKQLFEWVDGPLVKSMQDGSFFMADEISLAEDSVLERLNSVLEPERTILLAEKGGIDEKTIDCEIIEKKSADFVIVANDNFKFLATMNPGGDFGKKELSPALRNRFTEIWCKPSTEFEDLVKITANIFNESSDFKFQNTQNIANILVKTVIFIKEKVDKFKFSVRDLIAWALYIIRNSEKNYLQLPELIIFGLETIFLDSLEMLCQESIEVIDNLRKIIIVFIINQMNCFLKLNLSNDFFINIRGKFIEVNDKNFGIKPFYVEINKVKANLENNFFFEAPTTFKNLFRLLSAISLNKAILLEGPPGVGKTSIIESLANKIGFKIVRINLCEHTDLADLFGTDLPVEENSFNIIQSENSNNNNSIKKNQPGSFEWHNGPLLSALISENVWILLDELNLAPQSVLEGLNAILDHRNEVFIPELNKTFNIGKGTRIFACQNPLKQGGGRKGLPQSFLNRFTKVFLRKLNTEDLLYVINNKYNENFQTLHQHFEKFLKHNELTEESLCFFDIIRMCKTQNHDFEHLLNNFAILNFNLSERMVKFSEKLDQGIANLEFGYQGGPFEINLRDILRWCDSLFDGKTGFVFQYENNYDSFNSFLSDVNNFMLCLYERMKLIYCERMRSDEDRNFVENAFSAEFNCNIEELNKISEDISFFFTDTAIYLNDVVIERKCEEHSSKIMNFSRYTKDHPLILNKQKKLLKNLIECVYIEKPILLCGSVDSGKTKLIDLFCDISNKFCHFDNIDDSVTGSFQQIDFNRHLEEISSKVEIILRYFMREEFINEKDNSSTDWLLNVCILLKDWKSYKNINGSNFKIEPFQTVVDAIRIFKLRINGIQRVIKNLLFTITSKKKNTGIKIENLNWYSEFLSQLKTVIKKSEALNSGGYFEWIDSKIVKCLKSGEYICLEHANLCSSAVLDRLNSVFEPNGQLLISEKGVACGYEAEIVEKHKDFRVFLTIDPKNGELSRAMRNRCIEISLGKECYTKSDLRKIVYVNGITKSYCIEAILKMYSEIKSLNDFNNFTISHLVQVAFLVAAYNRIGFDDVKSIYLAGMDIFVYASKTDLLGYGIDFYQNKLREIVSQSSEYVKNKKNKRVNMKNIILTSKNLNCLSLVKLQLEPFSILLNNFNNFENAKSDFEFLFNEFHSLEFINNELFLKFYLFIIYQMSVEKDIKYRYYILEKIINTNENIPKDLKEVLIHLNEVLYFVSIQMFKTKRNDLPIDLPWNIKIFPRIRTYRSIPQYMNENFASKLSGLLIYEILIEKLPIESNIKIKHNKITAYNYSYSVNTKLINDKTNNPFIKHLYTFINELKLVLKMLTESIDNNTSSLIEIILKYFWLKRYLIISNQKLFDETNEINIGLLDQLYLHFKWINKNILQSIDTKIPKYKETCDKFDNINVLLLKFMDESVPNLNLLKKCFVKNMTSFNIPESLDQIQHNAICNQFDQIINVIPSYGKFDCNTILKKHQIISSSESQIIKSILLNKNCNLFMNKIRKELSDIKKHNHQSNTNVDKTIIEKLLYEYHQKQLECDYTNNEIDLDTLTTSLNNINSIINNEEYEHSHNNEFKFSIELLSLKEYFINNIFTTLDENHEFGLNEFFVESTSSLRYNNINLLQIISSEEHKNFKKMWIKLIKYIIEKDDLKEFLENNSDFIKLSNYKKYSTYDEIIQNSIKLFKLSNLRLKPECCFDVAQCGDINNDITYKGPYLINIVNKLLLSYNGELRQISIKELPNWKRHLIQINEILWFNSLLIDNKKIVIENFKAAMLYSKKVLIEINFILEKIKQNYPNEIIDNNYRNFMELTENLNKNILLSSDLNIELEQNLSLNIICKLEQKTALFYALIGCIQLHLITFTPLIDPIEKNRFKKQYFEDDVDILNNLSNVYNIISIAMEYNNLGAEYRNGIKKKVDEIKVKSQKYIQKTLEKRPESNSYSIMVQDIRHYLNSNCQTSQLLSILSKVSQCWNSEKEDKYSLQLEINESIKITKLWILNSQQFLQQILKKYPSYYEDILQPIECALTMTRYGFENIIKNLVQIKNSSIFEIENNLKLKDLYNLLENLVQYPALEYLSSNKRNNLFAILEKIDSDHYQAHHIKILKSKLCEVKTSVCVSLEIDTKMFIQLNDTIISINQIWNKQEELKKIKQIEEDSLFTIKTRCVNENEEEEDLIALQELFPTTVNEDFAEFLDINPLDDNSSQLVKNKNNPNQKDEILNESDFQFVAEYFMELLETYSKTSYFESKTNFKQSYSPSHEFNKSYNDRLYIFQKIFGIYKLSLNETFDTTLYNTFRLIIKLHQDEIENCNKSINDDKNSYNIYKDSNIPEISSSFSLLEEIENRTNKQLELYPDHATLIDILKIISRINNFAITSTIIRFNIGFQLLRQKLSQWNEVAHKNNHMQDLEIQTAEYVQRWTKLELQFWRNCLIDSKYKVETSAYKYWFFIFNLINEFLVNEEESSIDNIETKLVDLTKIVKQFLESSCYGDFLIRLRLLKSFELFLNVSLQLQGNEKIKKLKLITILYNIRMYYEQFTNEIEEFKKNLQGTVEKKLKDLVKIESFNKDLSYFSMKNNIARVHRNINKFTKEYGNGLKTSISKVFEHKEANLNDINIINDKGGKHLRNDPKRKYYMIDTKHFIALEKLKDHSTDLNDDSISNISNSSSSNRLDKLFLTSRNLCKKIISKIEYPKLTNNLEGLLSNYFETYEHLHNLNVDRSQEKSKQIAQNKHFIQLKRKALSDVFKTLTILGINFKTGLMEISVDSELFNIKIEPFSINILLSIITLSKTLNQNFNYLSEDLNLYYSKCTYKMKILKNALSNPNAELGLPNIDRLKGCSVDMFILVQNQRNLLSLSVNSIYKLRLNVINLIKLIKCSKENNYDESKLNFVWLENQLLCLKDVFNKINIFVIQFKLLFETIPLDCNKENNVFINNEKLFLKNSNKYMEFIKQCDKILKISKESIKELKHITTLEPLNYEVIQKLLDKEKQCLDTIKKIHSDFISSSSSSPIVDNLLDLITYVSEIHSKYDNIEKSVSDVDADKINTEIENMVHTPLIVIQNLFKKYIVDEKINIDKKNELINIGESEVYKNHLKDKIYNAMNSDFEILYIQKLSEKIENIYLAIKHSSFKSDLVKKIIPTIPILHQYTLLCYYNIFQQLGAHRVSVKMLYVMLSAFIELSSKGFCSPPDLIQDEDGKKQQQNSKSEGGGFSEDQTTGNEKDVSDQIENEDQLDDAKKPEERQNEKDENTDCKEEKGIEMSENFDADLQDLEKDEKDEKDDDEKSNNDEETDLDKEMGDTEPGAEKLDDQIWGSDNEEDENSEDENEASEDEHTKGCKDENETHNDLDAKTDKSKKDDEIGTNQEQLDATDNTEDDSKEKKQKEKDIDNMEEPEVDEDQINPYHNDLEEPPQAEDMQLDENVNLDEGADQEKEQKNDTENPFDIDKMKDSMEIDEQIDDNNEKEDEKNENDKSEDLNNDSDEENYDNLKREKENEEIGEESGEENDQDNQEKKDEQNNDNEDVNDLEKDGKNEDITEEQEVNDENMNEKYEESKDQSSKEENVQSNETDEVKGTNDQVKDCADKNVEQQQNLDDQETGEDGKGVGQANDEKADSGHQSIAETKELDSIEKKSEEKDSKMKNKPQKSDENRTLGEQNKETLKNLKTIDKNKSVDEHQEDEQEKEDTFDADEFQHIKEPEKSKITAIDNATEEQSKKIQHLSDEEENNEIDDKNDEKDENIGLNDEEVVDEINNLEAQEIKSEKNKNKTDKAKSNEIKDDNQNINEEKIEVEGETAETYFPLRSSDTTAHCLKENLNTSSVQESSVMETIEMRKLYRDRFENNMKEQPGTKDYEIWKTISTLMQSNARDLCEQLRLILEPTKCTKLKGDYKTGRRINMKKIIPYIASQFRKDKIWLRRTKPSQRDYKITIAIDDSKSMHHNNSKEITLKAISLVSQALTLLESGKLNILSFGESPKIILRHYEQFDGPKLVNSLNFEQNQSRIAELLDFSRTVNIEEGSSSTDNRLFENLLLILSDGRNIFSEGEQKVKNSVKLARLQRIFIVYIIIDNPENKHSILDIRVPNFSLDRKTITMKSYLDTFPFPYYIIVRDLDQLPLVLSEAMRQWFELVSSEQ